jgi:hypothetical protein
MLDHTEKERIKEIKELNLERGVFGIKTSNIIIMQAEGM